VSGARDRRIKLGSWRCRSGNSVDVYLRPDAERPHLYHTDCEWDDPPPFSDADFADYVVIIQPSINRRVQEYIERTGRVLTVYL
jgi:hypothetical protein